jgi:hypothetical protein
MTRSLQQFLTDNKSTPENPSTHTRIPDKNLGIYAGSYHIAEKDEPEFYDLVYKEVIMGNRLEYLTEKQHKDSAIYVDLDFRYAWEITSRQHSKDWVETLVCVYLDCLKKLMKVDKPFKLYVMEKDNVNRLADGSLTKDGIHIIIGINCPKTIQLKLREMVMKEAEEYFAELPLINSLDGVFDDGLSKGTTNAQLFGSRKPGNEAYKLTGHYNISVDPTDNNFCMSDQSIAMTKELFLDLCVRNKSNRIDFEFTDLAKKLLNVVLGTCEEPQCAIDLTACETDIQKLLVVIGSTRCEAGTNAKWTAVGQAIKNELKDEGLSDFVNWTNTYGTADKKKDAIVHYQKYIKYTPKAEKARLTIGSLHHWARLDNPSGYRMAFPIIKKDAVEIAPDMIEKFNIIHSMFAMGTEYEMAHAVNLLYPGLYKCVDKQRKEYYCFNDESKLWEFDVGGTPIRNLLSIEFYDLAQKYYTSKQEELAALDPNAVNLTKLIKVINDTCVKLKRTNDKNNILTEFSDMCKDTKFPATLNRSEYILPTNDGNVLDMRLPLRTAEEQKLALTKRTIEHNFSFECNAKLIPYDENDKNFKTVDKYFNDLFCGNKETISCVINILKSVFIGKPLRYIYICIGSGSNGKSLLFKILNKIFGKFMDIISENVIIEQKGNKSALNTEIEKLDKCRVGYITELKETDVLNEKIIKQISGGDEINLRTLHTKDQTITPTCNCFVLTNEMPKFNGEAAAMLNRLITIPFKAKFPVKSEFEREMLDISDYIFTYIMCRGVISDKFELSKEMIEDKNIHAGNNTDTTFADYFNSRLVDCVNDKKDNKLLLVNSLRVGFEHYCKINTLINTVSERKFATKLRELGYNIKKSDSKVMLYDKKFVEECEELDAKYYEEVSIVGTMSSTISPVICESVP